MPTWQWAILPLVNIEKIIEESTEALRIDPTRVYSYVNLAGGYMAQNRFGESKAVLEQALAQKLDWVGVYGGLYRLALIAGGFNGSAAIRRKIENLSLGATVFVFSDHESCLSRETA